jgi:hypothetical protein
MSDQVAQCTRLNSPERRTLREVSFASLGSRDLFIHLGLDMGRRNEARSDNKKVVDWLATKPNKSVRLFVIPDAAVRL